MSISSCYFCTVAPLPRPLLVSRPTTHSRPNNTQGSAQRSSPFAVVKSYSFERQGPCVASCDPRIVCFSWRSATSCPLLHLRCWHCWFHNHHAIADSRTVSTGWEYCFWGRLPADSSACWASSLEVSHRSWYDWDLHFKVFSFLSVLA